VSSSPSIAFVGRDGQLRVMPVTGGLPRQVSWSLVASGFAGAASSEAEDARTWPAWSPDGRWLASLRGAARPAPGASAALVVTEVDGVEERVICELPAEHPIYAAWSPDGRELAVLGQVEDGLQLQVVSAQGGVPRPVEHGVPLFFCWAPDSRGLIVHAGALSGGGRLSEGGKPGRLVRRAVGPRGDDAVFPVLPGSFCSPLPVPGPSPRVAFATVASGPTSHICTAQPGGEQVQHIATLRGLLAPIPDHEGRRLAIGSASEGERGPYEGIWCIDLAGGPLHQITTHDNVAFTWCPGGRRLVYVALDAAAGCARWYRIDLPEGDLAGAQEQELCPFWPTRDQTFRLRFFEQYAVTHPQVDPSGRWLVYTSHPEDPVRGRRGPPQIMLLDLDAPDPAPVALAEGGFPVFAPG